MRRDHEPGALQRRGGSNAATMLAGNLLLAIVWVAMSGQLSVENLPVGFVVG